MVGGQEWRNSNNFAVTWANPPENDRAPIVAAGYKLCAAGGGRCNRGEQTGPGIARLGGSGSVAGRVDLVAVAT